MAKKVVRVAPREKYPCHFDGDVDFGEIETTDSKGNIKISVPYMSGPELCDISNRFGLTVHAAGMLRTDGHILTTYL
jgi:hypothetical protein